MPGFFYGRKKMTGEAIANGRPGIAIMPNAILTNIHGKTVPDIGGPSLAHPATSKTLNQNRSFASSKDL